MPSIESTMLLFIANASDTVGEPANRPSMTCFVLG
jgi:hypothetical protein